MLYSLDFLYADTLACHFAVLCLFNIGKETLFGNSASVIAILSIVHSEFPKFLIVLAGLPTKFFHLLAILVQNIGIETLWISIGKFKPFLFCQLNNFGCNFTRQTTTLTKYHTPHALIHTAETWFILSTGKQVHQCDVLYILAERCYKRRITYTWPYICNLIE